MQRESTKTTTLTLDETLRTRSLWRSGVYQLDKDNMGRIISHYIPDHFTHATLAKELAIEYRYLRSHPGEIDPDAFWTKAVASYESSPRLFLLHHQCPLLDRILKHDHLPQIPIPPHFLPCVPCEPCEPMHCGTGDPPPTHPGSPHGVPEPASMLLMCVSMVVVTAFYRWRRYI